MIVMYGNRPDIHIHDADEHAALNLNDRHVDRGFCSLKLCLNGSVVQIPNPAADAVCPRGMIHSVPESDPLHITAEYNVFSDAFHDCAVCFAVRKLFQFPDDINDKAGADNG